MIYNNLILNKYVFKKLTSFHNKNHLPNAFIFHGSEGVGKEAHALEFFAFINCMENNINEACGTCKSCNKVKKIQHELLNLIVPLPKTKPIGKNSNPLNALSNKEQAELINQFSKKGVEPYHKIVLDKANTIPPFDTAKYDFSIKPFNQFFEGSTTFIFARISIYSKLGYIPKAISEYKKISNIIVDADAGKNLFNI